MEISAEAPIIQFQNVWKSYKSKAQTVEALKGVSFSIRKGDIFGFLGPNGAGKTTTLKILVGLIRDHIGQVEINGTSEITQAEKARVIGYMPQDVGFQEWRTVEHTLFTFGQLSSMNKSDLKVRIQEVLQLVGLEEARNRKIKHLSGGMQQKLKLAQALLHKPQLLVLDEPMSGLDPTARFQMKNIIKHLVQGEVTIIFSSHILGDVEDIASHIGILNYGQMVKFGTTADLKNELIGKNTIEIIGGDFIAAESSLKAMSIVREVQFNPKFPGRMNIVLTDDVGIDTATVEIMDLLSRNKIPIRHYNHLQPSLEQVYLKYVGGGHQL